MNVAHDCPVEVKIADQIGRVNRRKRRIDIEAIARKIIVFLRDVDLRIRTRNETAQSANENCDNQNETRHTPETARPPSFYNSTPTVCQGFTRHNRSAKVTALSFSFSEEHTRFACTFRRPAAKPAGLRNPAKNRKSSTTRAQSPGRRSNRSPDLHCVLRKWRALVHTRVQFSTITCNA